MSNTKGCWPKFASTTSPGVWRPTVGYKLGCKGERTGVEGVQECYLDNLSKQWEEETGKAKYSGNGLFSTPKTILLADEDYTIKLLSAGWRAVFQRESQGSNAVHVKEAVCADRQKLSRSKPIILLSRAKITELRSDLPYSDTQLPNLLLECNLESL